MITIWVKNTTLRHCEWMKDGTLGYYNFTEIGDRIELTVHPQSLAEFMGICDSRYNTSLYISDIRIDKHLLSRGMFFRP